MATQAQYANEGAASGRRWSGKWVGATFPADFGWGLGSTGLKRTLPVWVGELPERILRGCE